MKKDGLSAGEQRFVDAVGAYFERQGAQRIGGRILGLLMLAREPLSPARVAQLLHVSPASVSTNIRNLQVSGVAEQATVPGDRRHYYIFSNSGWEGHLRRAVENLTAFSRVCTQAVAAPDVPHKQRLNDALEYAAFMEKELATLAERWRAHLAGRSSAAADPSPRARRGVSR